MKDRPQPSGACPYCMQETKGTTVRATYRSSQFEMKKCSHCNRLLMAVPVDYWRGGNDKGWIGTAIETVVPGVEVTLENVQQITGRRPGEKTMEDERKLF